MENDCLFHVQYHGRMDTTKIMTIPNNVTLVLPLCCGIATLIDGSDKEFFERTDQEIINNVKQCDRTIKIGNTKHLIIKPNEQYCDIRIHIMLDCIISEGIYNKNNTISTTQNITAYDLELLKSIRKNNMLEQKEPPTETMIEQKKIMAERTHECAKIFFQKYANVDISIIVNNILSIVVSQKIKKIQKKIIYSFRDKFPDIANEFNSDTVDEYEFFNKLVENKSPDIKQILHRLSQINVLHFCKQFNIDDIFKTKYLDKKYAPAKNIYFSNGAFIYGEVYDHIEGELFDILKKEVIHYVFQLFLVNMMDPIEKIFIKSHIPTDPTSHTTLYLSDALDYLSKCFPEKNLLIFNSTCQPFIKFDTMSASKCFSLMNNKLNSSNVLQYSHVFNQNDKKKIIQTLNYMNKHKLVNISCFTEDPLEKKLTGLFISENNQFDIFGNNIKLMSMIDLINHGMCANIITNYLQKNYPYLIDNYLHLLCEMIYFIVPTYMPLVILNLFVTDVYNSLTNAIHMNFIKETMGEIIKVQ